MVPKCFYSQSSMAMAVRSISLKANWIWYRKNRIILQTKRNLQSHF